MGRNCSCRGRCDCYRKIVHPTREEVKNVYTEETIKHIYPTHTTIVNNHTIRNVFAYPHSTSYETRVREIDVRNNNIRGTENSPESDVAGARDTRNPNIQSANRNEGVASCGRGCKSSCHCGRRQGGFWF